MTLNKHKNIFQQCWFIAFKRLSKQSYRLHLAVACLVLAQIISSSYIHPRSITGLNSLGWIHILGGLALLVLGTAFTKHLIAWRKLAYFYPYLFGLFQALINDLKLLFKAKLPKSKPGGIVAIIQGFGLIAFWLVVLSGTLWFVSWDLELSFSHTLKHWHEKLTLLIEIYLYGHGAMAIIHTLLERFFPQRVEA